MMLSDRIRRVVLVAPRHPEMSGGSRYVSNFATALREQGIVVEVLSINPSESLTSEEVRVVRERRDLHSGPLLRGRSRGLARLMLLPKLLYKRTDRWRYQRKYRKYMESLDSSTLVIFTHIMAKQLLDESGFAKHRSQAIFACQHHSQFESIYREVGLEQQLAAHTRGLDFFTALTEPDAGKFSKFLNLPTYAVGNPFGLDPLPASVPTKVAVSFARFSPEKRLDLMIQLFLEAVSGTELSDWQLEIYGSGQEEEKLRGLLEEANVGDRVRLPGASNEVLRQMSKAGVNLLTSSYEGLPTTIIEAALVGVPTIAFDCSPGVHQLVSDDRGYLVENDDRDAYVKALRQALGDSRGRSQRGRAAHDFVKNNYSNEAIVQRWSQIVADFVDVK